MERVDGRVDRLCRQTDVDYLNTPLDTVFMANRSYLQHTVYSVYCFVLEQEQYISNFKTLS